MKYLRLLRLKYSTIKTFDSSKNKCEKETKDNLIRISRQNITVVLNLEFGKFLAVSRHRP